MEKLQNEEPGKKQENKSEDYITHLREEGNTRRQTVVGSIHTVHKNDPKHRSEHYDYRQRKIGTISRRTGTTGQRPIPMGTGRIRHNGNDKNRSRQ